MGFAGSSSVGMPVRGKEESITGLNERPERVVIDGRGFRSATVLQSLIVTKWSLHSKMSMSTRQS